MGSISSLSHWLILARGGRFTPLTRGLFDDGIPNQPKPIVHGVQPKKILWIAQKFLGIWSRTEKSRISTKQLIQSSAWWFGTMEFYGILWLPFFFAVLPTSYTVQWLSHAGDLKRTGGFLVTAFLRGCRSEESSWRLTSSRLSFLPWASWSQQLWNNSVGDMT